MMGKPLNASPRICPDLFDSTFSEKEFNFRACSRGNIWTWAFVAPGHL